MAIIFPKDLVLIDFESTYVGLEQAEPLQIGVVLLDRETLAEKKSFVSYVYADLSSASPEELSKNGITQAMVQDAPPAAQVAKNFVEMFGTDFIFSSWASERDRRLFRKLMAAGSVDLTTFDYHVYDLWPIAYMYLLERGYTGSMRSEEMFQAFGMPARGTHDALEDCRLEAAILRKILDKE